jgi:hypothetical protein
MSLSFTITKTQDIYEKLKSNKLVIWSEPGVPAKSPFVDNESQTIFWQWFEEEWFRPDRHLDTYWLYTATRYFLNWKPREDDIDQPFWQKAYEVFHQVFWANEELAENGSVFFVILFNEKTSVPFFLLHLFAKEPELLKFFIMNSRGHERLVRYLLKKSRQWFETDAIRILKILMPIYDGRREIFPKTNTGPHTGTKWDKNLPPRTKADAEDENRWNANILPLVFEYQPGEWCSGQNESAFCVSPPVEDVLETAQEILPYESLLLTLDRRVILWRELYRKSELWFNNGLASRFAESCPWLSQFPFLIEDRSTLMERPVEFTVKLVLFKDSSSTLIDKELIMPLNEIHIIKSTSLDKVRLKWSSQDFIFTKESLCHLICLAPFSPVERILWLTPVSTLNNTPPVSSLESTNNTPVSSLVYRLSDHGARIAYLYNTYILPENRFPRSADFLQMLSINRKQKLQEFFLEYVTNDERVFLSVPCLISGIDRELSVFLDFSTANNISEKLKHLDLFEDNDEFFWIISYLIYRPELSVSVKHDNMMRAFALESLYQVDVSKAWFNTGLFQENVWRICLHRFALSKWARTAALQRTDLQLSEYITEVRSHYRQFNPALIQSLDYQDRCLTLGCGETITSGIEEPNFFERQIHGQQILQQFGQAEGRRGGQKRHDDPNLSILKESFLGSTHKEKDQCLLLNPNKYLRKTTATPVADSIQESDVCFKNVIYTHDQWKHCLADPSACFTPEKTKPLEDTKGGLTIHSALSSPYSLFRIVSSRTPVYNTVVQFSYALILNNNTAPEEHTFNFLTLGDHYYPHEHFAVEKETLILRNTTKPSPTIFCSFQYKPKEASTQIESVSPRQDLNIVYEGQWNDQSPFFLLIPLTSSSQPWLQNKTDQLTKYLNSLIKWKIAVKNNTMRFNKCIDNVVHLGYVGTLSWQEFSDEMKVMVHSTNGQPQTLSEWNEKNQQKKQYYSSFTLE